MPFQAPGNRTYGTLSAPILASATSLALTTGHGGRFAAITAGNYFYLILVDTNETDLNDNWEVVKVTARSSDTFTIERGFDGTSPKGFPRTPNNPVTGVRVYAPTSELQMRMYLRGGGALVQAAMPTMTVDSPELLLLTPTAAGNLDLPTTNVFAGERFEVHNFSVDTADVVTIRASGGTTVCLLEAGLSVVLRAIQDTPTTNAHWKAEGSFIDYSTLFVYGGTSTKHFKPMGAVDVDTTQDVGDNDQEPLINYTIPGGSIDDGGFLLAFNVGSASGSSSLEWRFSGDSDLSISNGDSGNDWFILELLVRAGGNRKRIAVSTLNQDASGNTNLVNIETAFTSTDFSEDHTSVLINTGSGTNTQEIMATVLAN